jgi:hypothetical protein
VADVADRGWINKSGVGGEEGLRSEVSRGSRCVSLYSILWTFRSPRESSAFAQSYMYNPTKVITMLH